MSLYPDGRRFAFTLIHDADSAYSRRLAPLFDVFDELGFKITVTVFTFWARWAENGAIWERWKSLEDSRRRLLAPKAVPLVDEEECKFYRSLADRGHEIGMHSASETSDTRENISGAFEYFKQVFGRFPTLYVEHSGKSNKDAQANEGSRPGSPYYNTDLLNQYGSWVWVDSAEGLADQGNPRFYDLIAANGSPLNRHAAERYGIDRAFVRTGRWTEGDGDGFLRWYSEANIDALENAGGLALVYTHLDAGWLDLETWKMREPIQQRLKYLASKGGWYVPGGVILDRIEAVNCVDLAWHEDELRITNRSSRRLEGLTILSHDERCLVRDDQVLRPGPHGEIVVGSIASGEVLSFAVRRRT